MTVTKSKIVSLMVTTEDMITNGAAFDILLGTARDLYENGFVNVSVHTQEYDEEIQEIEAQPSFLSSEDALLKVRESLMQYGMTETEALNALIDAKSKGVLFREAV